MVKSLSASASTTTKYSAASKCMERMLSSKRLSERNSVVSLVGNPPWLTELTNRRTDPRQGERWKERLRCGASYRSASAADIAQWNRRVLPAVAFAEMSWLSSRQVQVWLSTRPSAGSKQQGLNAAATDSHAKADAAASTCAGGAIPARVSLPAAAPVPTGTREFGDEP